MITEAWKGTPANKQKSIVGHGRAVSWAESWKDTQHHATMLEDSGSWAGLRYKAPPKRWSSPTNWRICGTQKEDST